MILEPEVNWNGGKYVSKSQFLCQYQQSGLTSLLPNMPRCGYIRYE